MNWNGGGGMYGRGFGSVGGRSDGYNDGGGGGGYGPSTMALVEVVGATTISEEATTTDTVIETITRVRELHPQVGCPQL